LIGRAINYNVVTHKGGHDSGHYECFRRQIVWPEPYSTPHPTISTSLSLVGTPGISVTPSRAATPGVRRINGIEGEKRSSLVENNGFVSPVATIETPISPAISSENQQLSSSASSTRTSTSTSQTTMEGSSAPSPTLKASPSPSEETSQKVSIDDEGGKKKRQKKNNKWWRISDDKIKEAKTVDVLAQQKEVYLLFYERVREYR